MERPGSYKPAGITILDPTPHHIGKSSKKILVIGVLMWRLCYKKNSKIREISEFPFTPGAKLPCFKLHYLI